MRSSFLLVAVLAAGSVLAQQTEPQKPEPPAYSVVEPKTPPKAKPAPRKRTAKANAKTGAKAKPRASTAGPTMARAEVVKPTGACVIKPVMTDQDLVNCGATPPRY